MAVVRRLSAHGVAAMTFGCLFQCAMGHPPETPLWVKILAWPTLLAIAVLVRPRNG
jgi:hypothetical protein